MRRFGAWTAFDVASVVLDVVGRVAIVTALLALSRGESTVSLVASLVATVAVVGRAIGFGAALELHLREAFDDAARIIQARPILEVLRPDETGEQAAQLVAAARIRAEHRAAVVPRSVALCAQIVVFGVAAVVLLGPGVLLGGAGLVVVLGGVAMLLHRGVRAARQGEWGAFGRFLRDVRVLSDGALELRAQGRDRAAASSMAREGRDLARAERRALEWGALATLLPVALGTASLAGPARAGARWVTDAFASGKLVEATTLGGALFFAGVEVVRLVEARTRWAVAARSLPALAGRAADAPAAKKEGGALAVPDLRRAVIELDGFGYRYPGATRWTPAPTSLRWSPGRGLAIVGENGAGKSTLLLCLLGLLPPGCGRVTFDGVDSAEIDLAELRGRTALVPQRPFLLPGESIGWHVRLLGEDLSDADLDAALTEVALAERLRARADQRGVAVRDLPVGELSGGERQRMSIARALASGRELLVFDEPEIGLDARGRELVREVLDRVASSRRVLVIAHDPAVIPPSFEVVRLLSCDGASDDARTEKRATFSITA